MEESHAKTLKNKLKGISPISSECCIYRVPKRLRDVNEKAYTPQVVSLGPIHHGGEGLEAMEDHKMRYVKDFFERTNVNLEDCFNSLKEWEGRIRSCYAVNIEFSEEELVEMILVDGIFTVEVLLRSAFPTLQQESDRIFGKPWMDRDVVYDMLMLENQLPFFVLDYFYSLAHASNTIPLEKDTELSLIKLTHTFFEEKVYIRPLEEVSNKLSQYSGARIQHFVDYILKCHRPSPSELPPKRKLDTLSIPSATQLKAAGVHFMVVHDTTLFNIQFENGTLKIPQLRIRGSTEVFFRNLIAYEQFEFNDHYISDYVFIIDHLLDSSRDVELLARKGILESKLSDSKAVTTFISTLDLGPILFGTNFYFTELCEKLNEYYGVPWNNWKASLQQDYLSSPWAILAITIATILLVLTLAQAGLSLANITEN
ncbi:hypothetical protein ACLB2K_019133 [Fragaria x ananassa]